MKTKLAGDWYDAETAKTWPEGSIVLIHRPEREHSYSGFLEETSWFRPDWVDSYFTRRGEPTLFCLLAKPEKKTPQPPTPNDK